MNGFISIVHNFNILTKTIFIIYEYDHNEFLDLKYIAYI